MNRYRQSSYLQYPIRNPGVGSDGSQQKSIVFSLVAVDIIIWSLVLIKAFQM